MASNGLEQIVPDARMKSPDIFAPLQNENPESEPSRALFHIVETDNQNKEYLLETPVDELTGIPLPVLPPDKVPDSRDTSQNNWHHHYHPSHHRLLISHNGLAVRNVRLQLLPAQEHHKKYHQIFEGPALPETNFERFGQIILATAGYIPPKAIDVYKDDPTEPVELTDAMRARLQNSGELQNRGMQTTGQFIKKYLIRQDLSSVSDVIIEEFVSTSKMDRKRLLGHWLLALASEIAAEPIEPIYVQALEEGLIARPAPKLRNIIKSQVNGKKNSRNAINGLHKRLLKVNGL